MKKTGLVVEGGGMRGVYGCGVLDSFLTNSVEFDYSIGVSAGAANIASFVAKQEHRNYRFYTQYAFDDRYMSLKNFLKTGSFFGMDFIYTELTNVIDPIDYDELLKHEFCIVATDAVTGKPKYFTNKDVKDRSGDIFKASCAVPAMCKPIAVDGREYYDGGVSDPVPVKRALAEGCEKIVAVLTRPHGYVKKPESAKRVYTEMLKNYPNVRLALNARHNVYNSTMEYLYRLEKQGKAMLFCPEETAGVNIITRNRTNLDKLYNIGKEEADARMQELKAFLYND